MVPVVPLSMVGVDALPIRSDETLFAPEVGFVGGGQVLSIVVLLVSQVVVIGDSLI